MESEDPHSNTPSKPTENKPPKSSSGSSQSTPLFPNQDQSQVPKTRSRPSSSLSYNKRRSSATIKDDNLYLNSSSIRHFSAASTLPHFRNKLAALSLTAGGSSGGGVKGSSRPSSSASNYSSTGDHLDTHDLPNRYRSHSRLSNRSKPSLSERLASSLAPIHSPDTTINTIPAPLPSITVNNFVVFDIGNRFIRAGFAGDVTPRCKIPAEWAWDKVKKDSPSFFSSTNNTQQQKKDDACSEQDTTLEGLKSEEQLPFLKKLQEDCTYWLWNIGTISIDSSFVANAQPGNNYSQPANHSDDEINWDTQWYKTRHSKRLECVLEVIIRHMFNHELLVDSKSQRVVVLENPKWPVAIKEIITKVFLRKLRCTSITFYPAPVLEMVAAGIRSGVVIDIGWEETTISPIYDLRLLSNKVYSTNRGAKQLHNEVKKVIMEHGKIIKQDIIENTSTKESKDSQNKNTTEENIPSTATSEPKKKRIRVTKRKVLESEVTFSMTESIIKECLYEYKDSPLVNARRTANRPYTFSGQVFGNTTSNAQGPISPTATTTFFAPSSSRTSVPHLPSTASSEAKASQDEKNTVHQYIKISQTETLAIPNGVLQSTVSSTFFGSPIYSSTLHSKSKHDRTSSSYSFSQVSVSGPGSTISTGENDYNMGNSNTGGGGSSSSNAKTHLSHEQLYDSSSLPLPTVISTLLTSLEVDLKAPLQSHLIFCGSSAQIPGLQARLLQDVRKLVPKNDKYGATSPLYIAGTKSLGAWTGASVYLEALSWYFVSEGMNNSYNHHHHHRHDQSQAQDQNEMEGTHTSGGSVNSKTKLPGEITREAYLTFGFYRLNVPYGVVI